MVRVEKDKGVPCVGILELHFSNGISATLEDEPRHDTSSHRYRLVNYFPKERYALISQILYEGAVYFIYRMQDGQKEEALCNGITFSPNGRYVATSCGDISEFDESGVKIWAVNEEPLKIVFKEGFDSFGIWLESLRWIDDSTVEIIFKRPSDELGVGSREIKDSAQVELHEGKWALRPASLIYDGNGNTSGIPPAKAEYKLGEKVTVSANAGSLALNGRNFAGWNTAADGSGVAYTGGTDILTMGPSNLTLYAEWLNCGESIANNCYTGTHAERLQATGTITTPLGKNIVYTFANGAGGIKVWKEVGSNRLLAANGLDQWSKKLNPTGNGKSTEDFTDPGIGTSATLIEGRTCPRNVYIDSTQKFTTENCLYYTPAKGIQALDASGDNGVLGLGEWSSELWYAGNIKTCSDKGMRLPTLYETAITAIPEKYAPISDGLPSAWGGIGVPASTSLWTASTYTSNSNFYWKWLNTAASVTNYNCRNCNGVRCVLP